MVPVIWTTISPFVFLETALLILLKSIFPVSKSMSTNTTFAPVYSTACEVAVWDIAGTITSSPFLKSAAKQDKWRAAVQLETNVQYFAFVNFFISSSNKLE